MQISSNVGNQVENKAVEKRNDSINNNQNAFPPQNKDTLFKCCLEWQVDGAEAIKSAVASCSDKEF